MFENFKDLSVVWPALVMGAIIPCVALLGLYVSSKRKEVAFRAALYGFGTFFLSLGVVVLLVFLVGKFFLSSIAISGPTDANVYIYVGGSLAMIAFYLAAEASKHFAFEAVKKQDQNYMAGLCVGSGFILAQNLLIFGLVYAGEIDFSQAVSFGVLMLISGVIYLLICVIGYQLALVGHRVVGPAIASTYYLMFVVMLLFANMVVTYSFVAAVLIFNLVIGYVLLPLPFKKEKGA